jgi:hypothetical protein
MVYYQYLRVQPTYFKNEYLSQPWILLPGNNNDSAPHFHEQQLKLSKKLNLKIWQADAYSQ